MYRTYEEKRTARNKQDKELKQKVGLAKEHGLTMRATWCDENPNMEPYKHGRVESKIEAWRGRYADKPNNYLCRMEMGDNTIQFFYTLGSAHLTKPSPQDALYSLVMDAETFLVCYTDPWEYMEMMGVEMESLGYVKSMVQRFPTYKEQSLKTVEFLRGAGVTTELAIKMGMDEEDAEIIDRLLDEV